MVSVKVTLSEWLYRAVLSKSVLTLSREYFSLRKPLERRLYELARKHCGTQPSWRVSLEVLLAKTGSNSPRRVFRAMVREIAKNARLPDYTLTEEEGDIFAFAPQAQVLEPGDGPRISEATREAARAQAPGWDIYALEEEWRHMWAQTGRARLRAPDKAFLGWITKRLKG